MRNRTTGFLLAAALLGGAGCGGDGDGGSAGGGGAAAGGAAAGGTGGTAAGGTDGMAAGGTGGTAAGGTGGTAAGGTGGAAAGGTGGAAAGGSGGVPMACLPADPNSYPAQDFDTNAAVELGVGTRLRALNGAMAMAEAMSKAGSPIVVTRARLMELFADGDPSVKSVTTPFYVNILEAMDSGVFALFEPASDKQWTPADPPVGSGGLAGNWIFSADGRDLRQLVEKGLFTAALFNHALTLIGQATTPAHIDRLMAISGFPPAFPSDSAMSEMVPVPDRFIAQYAERRSPKDLPTSIYATLKSAFIHARAAAAGGAPCAAALQARLTEIRGLLDKSLITTVLYYANDGLTKLAAAGSDLAMQAAAVHSIGEGIGFTLGYRGLPAAARVITDAQVDELLALMNTHPELTPLTRHTVYRFITSTLEAAKLNMAVARIKAIYGLTDEEVERYKVNY